jgi:ubiquinone/menaquinone biosynthesis C-methylase UbiE
MVRGFLKNCRKPQGTAGRFVAKAMNVGHSVISKWGLTYLNPARDARVLDIGCGGGANIKLLLDMCPDGFVNGLDYSEQSVAVSRKKNAAALGKRCDILQGSVSAMPFDDGAFDAVIAFETIYFWPDIVGDFREVRRVLRPGGAFLICNDACDPANEMWSSRIEGMRIYSGDEIARLLSESGFEVTGSHTHKNGWICVSAVRAEGKR